MRTLDEMNAKPFRRAWGDVTLETTYAVGYRSRRYRSSDKVHLLEVTIVVETGRIHSVMACCNGNGDNYGAILKGKDTDAVTCSHCR